MNKSIHIVLILLFAFSNVSKAATEGYAIISGDRIVIKNRRIENAVKIFEASPNATYIHLYRNKLKEIPKEIALLQNLEVLIIGGNPLVKLPEEIGQLAKLRKLSIRRNDLTSLPASLGDLSMLEELYVSFNDLIELPEELGKLSNLQFLDISNNRIEVIPDSFCKMSSLRFFIIGRNNLLQLPENIYLLTELVELDLVGSGTLIRIPEALKEIRTLERIYIDDTIVVPFAYFNLNPKLRIIVQTKNSVLK